MGFYLAMTPGELAACPRLPENCGYLGCHFSSSGTGLSGLPQSLPRGSLLIVTDQFPIHRHDPEKISEQVQACVEDFGCSLVLLDFQRPGNAETRQVVKSILRRLPGITGVSHLYGEGLDCPVFLPPPPLWTPLKEHLAPWAGRVIWQEVALERAIVQVTAAGAAYREVPPEPSPLPHFSPVLCCHYGIYAEKEQVEFTLTRTKEDLESFLALGKKMGICHFIGLYQELGEIYDKNPQT